MKVKIECTQEQAGRLIRKCSQTEKMVRCYSCLLWPEDVNKCPGIERVVEFSLIGGGDDGGSQVD